jgi:hypothetical protein
LLTIKLSHVATSVFDEGTACSQTINFCGCDGLDSHALNFTSLAALLRSRRALGNENDKRTCRPARFAFFGTLCKFKPVMRSPEQTELIEHAEFYLEDIHEGLIALDRALKLLRREVTNLPISEHQAINVVFYIASAVARDIERLDSVKLNLSPRVAKQLAKYSERLGQRNRTVLRLKSEDDINRQFALRDHRIYNR